MTYNLRADLAQLLPRRRHIPVADRLRRRQRAQEVAEFAGECMTLKANRVGGVKAARKSRPFDRALAPLDPLLARAALVVEGDGGGALKIGRFERVALRSGKLKPRLLERGREAPPQLASIAALR